MTPLTVFIRSLMTTSAIFLGAGVVFLNPPLDRSPRRSALTATQSPVEGAVDGPIAALKDGDREQAAWALGAIDHREAAPALIAALKDIDVRVRRQAAWALGAVGR